MPMPREEEDDLFHDEADVDFADDDEETAEKPARKTAKKTAKKKTAKKKAAPKKKKKAKAAEADAAPPKRKRKKKVAPPEEEAEEAAPEAEVQEEPAAEALEVAEANGEETAAADSEESTDEYGRPAPVANYTVHVYELGRWKRTIDREFTPEEAEAFATAFTKTSKRYGRQAVAGKKDTQPAKVLDE